MLDVKLLLEWGDAITLLSKKFNIPPLLEQAAEKYSQACSIEPSSIICLIKWGAALSRCASSRFSLDFEFNENLFNLAESKFIEANELFDNTWNNNNQSDTSGDTDQESPVNTPRRASVASPPRPVKERPVTTIRESKQGVKVKLIKSSTPKSRLLSTVDRTSQGHKQLEYQLLIGWGRCLHRFASVLDQVGEFHQAMDSSLRSTQLFNRALHLQVKNFLLSHSIFINFLLIVWKC